jgi:hypothetical protein
VEHRCQIRSLLGLSDGRPEITTWLSEAGGVHASALIALVHQSKAPPGEITLATASVHTVAATALTVTTS